MLSPLALTQTANKHQVAKYVVLREYCEVVILNQLTTTSDSVHLFFKGGTAIRLLLNGNRYSEDLDFTVINLDPIPAGKIIETEIERISDAGTRTLKSLKTLAGKSYRLTWLTPILETPITIKIDLSFRESVILPKTSLLEPNYPILTTNYIHHLDSSEILAEKVRALMHRHKGRDLYDLWFLLSMQTEFNEALIKQKLGFYHETYSKSEFLAKIKAFPKNIFISDLTPFLGKTDRDRLPTLYDVIQTYLSQKLA